MTTLQEIDQFFRKALGNDLRYGSVQSVPSDDPGHPHFVVHVYQGLTGKLSGYFTITIRQTQEGALPSLDVEPWISGNEVTL